MLYTGRMRILSGIQPTGSYHIGNYLGAIRQWTEMQSKHDCLFMVVDLHAMTVPQDPATLRASSREKVIELLALGLDPEQCTLFIQSHVPQHAELAWILGTITPMGELERMTQYKDKKAKGANLGLFSYPVLMAADILIYKTEGVPVGKDQEQHLELTRDIARRFNARFGDTFPEPASLVPDGMQAKILSLQDPRKKMSKSDAPEAQISIFEDPEQIRKKIARAVTDGEKTVAFRPAKKPGVSNLLTILSSFSGTPIPELESRFKGKGYAPLKKETAEALVGALEVFRKKKREMESRDTYVTEVIRRGAGKASLLAERTMEEVRAKTGLLAP